MILSISLLNLFEVHDIFIFGLSSNAQWERKPSLGLWFESSMHWGFQDKKLIIDDCIFLNYCKKNLCVSNCLWGEWRVKMLWYLPSIVDYQLVFPIIVDHNGSFLSHWNSTHSSQHHRSTKQLHLNITGFNQTFRLHLHTSSNILAPGFKVYYRHGNSNHSNKAEEHSRECEFKGRLLSHSTEVALSLCGGVVSFHARYWFNSSIYHTIEWCRFF